MADLTPEEEARQRQAERREQREVRSELRQLVEALSPAPWRWTEWAASVKPDHENSGFITADPQHAGISVAYDVFVNEGTFICWVRNEVSNVLNGLDQRDDDIDALLDRLGEAEAEAEAWRSVAMPTATGLCSRHQESTDPTCDICYSADRASWVGEAEEEATRAREAMSERGAALMACQVMVETLMTRGVPNWDPTGVMMALDAMVPVIANGLAAEVDDESAAAEHTVPSDGPCAGCGHPASKHYYETGFCKASAACSCVAFVEPSAPSAVPPVAVPSDEPALCGCGHTLSNHDPDYGCMARLDIEEWCMCTKFAASAVPLETAPAAVPSDDIEAAPDEPPTWEELGGVYNENHQSWRWPDVDAWTTAAAFPVHQGWRVWTGMALADFPTETAARRFVADLQASAAPSEPVEPALIVTDVVDPDAGPWPGVIDPARGSRGGVICDADYLTETGDVR